jgi:hypothetical protein
VSATNIPNVMPSPSLDAVQRVLTVRDIAEDLLTSDSCFFWPNGADFANDDAPIALKTA